MARAMATTSTKARRVYEMFCAAMGETPMRPDYITQGDGDSAWYNGGPVLVRDLEDRGAFGIAWEGGMDMVPRDLWRTIENAVPNVFIESGGSWYVTIWPR